MLQVIFLLNERGSFSFLAFLMLFKMLVGRKRLRSLSISSLDGMPYRASSSSSLAAIVLVFTIRGKNVLNL